MTPVQSSTYTRKPPVSIRSLTAPRPLHYCAIAEQFEQWPCHHAFCQEPIEEPRPAFELLPFPLPQRKLKQPFDWFGWGRAFYGFLRDWGTGMGKFVFWTVVGLGLLVMAAMRG
jgi:hypothetical protein